MLQMLTVTAVTSRFIFNTGTKFPFQQATWLAVLVAVQKTSGSLGQCEERKGRSPLHRSKEIVALP